MTFFFSCKTEYRKIKETYSDGKTKIEFIYKDKNNKLNYTIKEYYKCGQLLFTGTVKNGMFVGNKINYYENGKLKEVDSLIKPCELNFCCCDGSVTKYKPNGKLEQSYENRNGLANGLVKLYDDSSGALSEVYSYANDKRNGAYTTFYPTGQIYSKGTYKNDTLVDYQYFFEESGDTIKYYYTFSGKMDFPYKKWLDDRRTLTGQYSKSREEVTYVWYDQNGSEIKRQVAKLNGKKWILPE